MVVQNSMKVLTATLPFQQIKFKKVDSESRAAEIPRRKVLIWFEKSGGYRG